MGYYDVGIYFKTPPCPKEFTQKLVQNIEQHTQLKVQYKTNDNLDRLIERMGLIKDLNENQHEFFDKMLELGYTATDIKLLYNTFHKMQKHLRHLYWNKYHSFNVYSKNLNKYVMVEFSDKPRIDDVDISGYGEPRLSILYMLYDFGYFTNAVLFKIAELLTAQGEFLLIQGDYSNVIEEGDIHVVQPHEIERLYNLLGMNKEYFGEMSYKKAYQQPYFKP